MPWGVPVFLYSKKAAAKGEALIHFAAAFVLYVYAHSLPQLFIFQSANKKRQPFLFLIA